MAKAPKPTGLQEDDPLSEAELGMTADELAEAMRLEAVRALGRVLKAVRSSPTEVLRAAEALLRFEGVELDPTRPAQSLSDADLLRIARGDGKHRGAFDGNDAPAQKNGERGPKEDPPRPESRDPRPTPVHPSSHAAQTYAPNTREHAVALLLRKPAPAEPKAAEPWE